MKTYRRTVLTACGLLLPWLGGCALGGKAISSDSTGNTGRGTVQINIRWPAIPKSRLIPLASQYIEVDLLDSNNVLQAVGSAQRPATGNTSTITLNNLPTGTFTETATAYPTPDITGTAQAKGSQQVTIVADTVNKTPDLTMGSTIIWIALTPYKPTAVAGGAPITLMASPNDAAGNLVLTVPSNIKWTVEPATTASLTSNGTSAILTGLAQGTAMVTVKELESGISSAPLSVAITHGVTPPAPNSILIADYGNNRIVGLDAIPPTKTQTYNDSISGKAFSSVAGMAYDSTGRIYVGDNYLGIVRVDDFAGTNRIAYAPSGIAVDAVCVDKAGKIYWTDSNATVNRIDDMTGKNHITFGNRTTLGYNLNSIAVDSLNRVYTFGSQVVRITDITNSSTASPNVTVFGSAGTATNQFSGYGGLAVDSSNKIYIADSGNSRIVRIDDMTGLNWMEFDVPKDAGTAVFPISVAVGSSATSSIYFLANASSVYKMTDMKGTGLTQLGALTNGVTALNSASAISVK